MIYLITLCVSTQHTQKEDNLAFAASVSINMQSGRDFKLFFCCIVTSRLRLFTLCSSHFHFSTSVFTACNGNLFKVGSV